MEFLQDNISNITMILTVLYPPLLYILPPNVAGKIDLGIKVIKVIADGLERAKNTKSGLSNKVS
jgi:hypothetical protein